MSRWRISSASSRASTTWRSWAASRVEAKLSERLARGPASGVDAIGRHRAVGVADGDDPRLDRDLLADQPIGIAAAVDPFVVMADGGRGHAHPADATDQLLADLGMRSHDPPLRIVERATLRQDAVGNRDLADVVQPATEAAAQQDVKREAEHATHVSRRARRPARCGARAFPRGRWRRARAPAPGGSARAPPSSGHRR